jgi:hypothetical protein
MIDLSTNKKTCPKICQKNDPNSIPKSMVQIDPSSIRQPKSISIFANLVDMNCRIFNVGN